MAACLFNAAWYFCLPYITAVIANIDTNGRLLVGLAVVFPTSLAVGPVLAASLLTGEGYGVETFQHLDLRAMELSQLGHLREEFRRCSMRVRKVV